MMKEFVIQHKVSGKLIQPKVGQNEVVANTSLVLSDSDPQYARFKFQPVDGQWGYITHVKSDYAVHPLGESPDSGDGTHLVLHPDRHAGALFRYDETNDHFIHKGGKYIHPQSGQDPTPDNGVLCILYDGTHEGMKFQSVSPEDVIVMPEFVIKHKASGKFFHQKTVSDNVTPNTNVVIWQSTPKYSRFKFQPVDGHWGYITHVKSDYIIHPHKGSINPGNETKLVLHPDRHAGALFAYDERNEHFIHKGGKFINPKSGRDPTPNNGVYCVLHEDIHYCMKFECVSPKDIKKEILVYGKPTISGSWKVIYSLLNSQAEHRETITFMVGRQQKSTTEWSFGFRWEYSASVSADMFSIASMEASASLILEGMLKKTSECTWSQEIRKQREIVVKPGQSVVTWQFVFHAQQHKHEAFFKSNILADTTSLNDEPDMTAPGFSPNNTECLDDLWCYIF